MGQKKSKRTTQQPKQVHTNVPNNKTPQSPIEQKSTNWLNGLIPYGIIALLSIMIYANTFQHSFALDDDIVICKNEYVLQGIQGLPDIFTKDLFDSFYKQMNTKAQLSGGRYRPLSVASFALEQEIIGTRENANYEANCWDANKNGMQESKEDINGDGLYNEKDCRSKGFMLRHINNVLFYAILCCIVFFFLSRIVFPDNYLLSFIITLLFAAHPIHTEVVANVKSRDEIFSLSFMLLTLYSSHQYIRSKQVKWLIASAILFLSALLSKEYGATLLFITPVSLYLFEKEKFSISMLLKSMMPLILSFIIYFMMRSNAGTIMGASAIQDKEILNNPFLLADDTQRMATKLFILLKYFFILVFPTILVSDYGYNSIPYKDFTDPWVWLALLSVIAVVVSLIISFKKRSWIAFAILFYVLNLLLVTNFIFNVGATMGERLAFHSSLGFCMLLGYGFYYLAEKTKNNRWALWMSIPIVLLYSIKTIARNPAWKNDIALALTDIQLQPNSTALPWKCSFSSS
jgi:hypothetical protein